MNLIRKWLINAGLLPITPADLNTLLDRAGDTSLPIRARLQALVEYTVFTQPPEQIETLFDTLNVADLQKGCEKR